MNRKWIYTGNISSFTSEKNRSGKRIITEIELYDIRDQNKAPIMLHVGCGLFGYINDIEWNDDEEKYMRKEFVYDRTLFLRKINVLNSEGKICKIIEDMEDVNWTARITGPRERINNQNQKALDRDEPTCLIGPESFGN